MGSFDNYIDKILPGMEPYDFADKKRNIRRIVKYFLNRTQSMFKWQGLPETIPERMLELYLQINGNVGIAERDGELYAFTGGMGGEPDPYYMPTIYAVANPALNFSKSFTIGEDIVVIPNDGTYQGLIPLMERYATGIVEAELSIYIALINSRLVDIFEAYDDRTKAGFDKMIEDVVRGKLAAVSSKSLDGAIKAFPYANSTSRTMTDLIEITQYLKASFFNEIGLNANYNMKRESINSGESQLNNDALLPLVDDMLKRRQDGAKALNEKFNLDISVAFASAWEDNEIEIAMEQKKISPEESEDSTRLENPSADEPGDDDNE